MTVDSEIVSLVLQYRRAKRGRAEGTGGVGGWHKD